VSDTKELNNRLDYVERKKVELEQELVNVRQKLAGVRAENTRLRTECRRLVDQFETVGTELRAQLSTCKGESARTPGNRRLAGQVRQADTSLRIYEEIANGGDDRG
jgi:predicted  nucleic acid-binding Zn-ribbon protein